MIGQLQTTVNVVLTTLHLADSRVLLKKLIIAQLVKKFPAVYRTRMFITVFTKHDMVSTLIPINQFHILPYFFKIHFNITLLHIPKLYKLFLPFRFSGKKLYTFLFSPVPLCKRRPFNPCWLGHPNNMWWKMQIIKFLITQLSPSSGLSLSLSSKIAPGLNKI
jgi:hypothetical protein